MADRILIQCPSCSAKVVLSDERKLEKKIRCPKCAEVFFAKAINANRSKASVTAKAAKQNPKKSDKSEFNSDNARMKDFDGGEKSVEATSHPGRPNSGRSENAGVQEETSIHRKLIVTGILAIALVLGVGAFFLFGRKGHVTQRAVSAQPVSVRQPTTKWRTGETEPVAALNPEEIPERLTLDAVTAWSPYSSQRLDQTNYFIDVVLQARGELVERICQFGEVRISSSGLDSGEEIKLFSEKSPGEFDPTTQWVPFDTKIPLTFDDPPGFLRIPIRIAQPKNMNARLSKFEGDFKIRIAESIDEFTIEEVAKVVENPIGIPALDAAGVRFHWNREQEGRYESLEMIVEDGYSVGRFEVTDAGQPINDLFLDFQKFSIHRSAERETVVRIHRGWTTKDGVRMATLPEKLKLKFALFSKLRAVVIPFRFSNLPLPSRESRSKFGN